MVSCKCGDKFEDKRGLRKHELYCDESGKKAGPKYFCDCGKSFVGKGSFKTHKNWCDEADRKAPIWKFEKTECPDCGSRVAKTQLEKHRGSKSCELGGVYKTTRKGVVDIKESWKVGDNQYKCPECGSIHPKPGIGSHIWSNHTEEGKAFYENRDFDPTENLLDENGERWNKGLTKEDHPSIKKYSEKISQIAKRKVENGKQFGFINSGYLGSEKHKEDASKGGGDRKGAGRGKRGYYKNYWCDSTWELVWIIYNLDKDVEFDRNREGFEYRYKGGIREFYPDFKLKDGTYVEVKGYHNKMTDKKIEYFPHEIRLVENDEIKPMIEYVKDNYGEPLESLYTTVP